MDLSELVFHGTLWEWIHEGRRAPLIAYVRSDKPLRPRDANTWPTIWKAKLNVKEGAHPVEWNHGRFWFLAGAVRAVKAELRERGERYRIHNTAIDRVLATYPVIDQKNYKTTSAGRSKSPAKNSTICAGAYAPCPT